MLTLAHIRGSEKFSMQSTIVLHIRCDIRFDNIYEVFNSRKILIFYHFDCICNLHRFFYSGFKYTIHDAYARNSL